MSERSGRLLHMSVSLQATAEESLRDVCRFMCRTPQSCNGHSTPICYAGLVHLPLWCSSPEHVAVGICVTAFYSFRPKQDRSAVAEPVEVNRGKEDNQRLPEVVPNCEAMHAWDERCFDVMETR